MCAVNMQNAIVKQIFDSLHGTWQINRIFTSKLVAYPSGSSQGNAFFENQVSKEEENSKEYLYNEETTFVPNDGKSSVRGSQKYAYVYKNSGISVYFVDKQTNALDRLFHNIQFKESTLKTSFIKANGTHFCNPDNYDVNYEFQFKDNQLSRWTIEYKVNGPRKDYTMSTCYSR